MVNFKKLADRAKMARTLVDQQGGSEGLKDKVRKLRGVAMSEGTVSERAKAAAAVAREKPNPAAPTPAEAAGPIGGGAAPPEVSDPSGPEAPPEAANQAKPDVPDATLAEPAAGEGRPAGQ